MGAEKIRVLVVDDSALMRKILGDILSSDPRIEVVGTARNGVDGLNKARTLLPDVITLDVEMPEKDGLSVLEELMATSPMPVIMVSSLSQDGAQTTLKALSLGCVDFVGKPSTAFSMDMQEMAAELISKVIMAKGARLFSPTRKDLTVSCPASSVITPRMSPYLRSVKREIVAIAASTGGPIALQSLLSNLPEDFSVPIVITQHMPKDFTGSFAKRLDTISDLSVVEGTEGMDLRAGVAVVAPGGSHLIVKRRQNGLAYCALSDAPPVLSVKPSANIMFSSVAQEFGGNVVGVILTGMGKDGADGAVELHSKGAHIIAESSESCVVFGMPKAAAEAGVVDELLPLSEIHEAILRSIR